MADISSPHATHSTPGVLIYDGRAHAVGLLWFTVQEDTAKSLLKQRIAKTHADFYCQRLHVSTQQGFGWLSKGHKRGMPVAAAMIADQLVGEWHGVFEADNGWWYVQVRSDTITPNGDQFFTSEEDAYNLFHAEMEKHTWPHAYAPAKWRISDTHIRELSLRALLDDLATTVLVGATLTAALGGAKQRNMVLAGIAAAFALMGGLVVHALLAPAVLPSSNFVPRQVNQNVVLTPPVTDSEFISPFQMLQQCGHAADQLLTSLPGWNIQNFTCGGTKAGISWQQETGTLGDAKEYGSAHWPANTAVTFANRVMTASLALDKLPTLHHAALPTQEEALLILEQDLQPLGALQVKPVVPAPPPPPAKNAPAPATPPVVAPPYLDIQFISGFSPEKIAALVNLPGVEMQNLQWTIPRSLWQYKFKWTHARTKTPMVAPHPGAQK